MKESEKMNPNTQKILFNKINIEKLSPQIYHLNSNHEFNIKIDALIKRIDNVLET